MISATTLKQQVFAITNFIILGCAGLGIHIVVGRNYGLSTLGEFNSALAYFLVFAQLANLGTFLGVLHFYAKPLHEMEARDRTGLLSTAIIWSTIGAAIVILLTWIYFQLGFKYTSPEIILLTALALPLFSVNKILLAFINGQNRMKPYFLLQSLRFVLMLVLIFLIGMLNMKDSMLYHIFWITELVLLCCTLAVIHPMLPIGELLRQLPKESLSLDKPILRHAFRSLPAGVIQELAVRIDIFMLTILVHPAQVGLYSVAAMIAEGINQITAVFKDQLSPVIGNHYQHNRYAEIRSVVSQTVTWSWIGFLPIALVSMLLFTPVTIWIFKSPALQEASLSFYILIIGLLIAAPFHVLNYTPNQVGQPLVLSRIIIAASLINIILNYFLIKALGIHGAAIATTVSWTCSLLMLGIWYRRFMHRHISLA